MDETSTKNSLNTVINNEQVEEQDVFTTLDADDLIFYHSLRNELNLLKKNPSLKIVHQILNYSKSLR